jgi:hypothetical protein
MQKHLNNPELKAGSRIRLSSLGVERCSRLKSRTGLVLGINPGGTSFRILIDGRKMPLSLHGSYIEPEGDDRPSGAAE